MKHTIVKIDRQINQYVHHKSDKNKYIILMHTNLVEYTLFFRIPDRYVPIS
jgi:hypothetical protein